MDKSTDNPSGTDDNEAKATNSDASDDKNQAGSSGSIFHKLKKDVKRRGYRKKRNTGIDDEVANDNTDDDDDNDSADVSSDDQLNILREIMKRKAENNLSSEREEEETQSKDDSETEVEVDDEKNGRESFVLRRPLVLRKIKPKCTFSTVNETINRQIGQSRHFQTRFYGSLRTVERLELLHSMKEHQSCVNTVEFNEKGDLLVSGSDDLAVCIWNWSTGKKRNSYESGHRNNIFQASWLPCDDSKKMVTCACDGQVRLLDLVQGTTRKLASHLGACNKFAIHPNLPHVVISVGDDGKVLSIDVRDDETNKLMSITERGFSVQLYSINVNPQNSNEFCIGGHSESVRIYDRRKLTTTLSKLCPRNLISHNLVNITAVTYNYNGTEVLASYNDDDIYLFDTLIPHPTGDYAHKYEGHRNSRTKKGVNYFGPNSEFIVSGSDCGNIFFWEKNSEAIVHYVRGDAQGVVNCVKPHPTIPVLASSGLDDDVKIWVPSAESPLSMRGLKQYVTANLDDRAEGRPSWENYDESNLFALYFKRYSENR